MQPVFITEDSLLQRSGINYLERNIASTLSPALPPLAPSVGGNQSYPNDDGCTAPTYTPRPGSDDGFLLATNTQNGKSALIMRIAARCSPITIIKKIDYESPSLIRGIAVSDFDDKRVSVLTTRGGCDYQLHIYNITTRGVVGGGEPAALLDYVHESPTQAVSYRAMLWTSHDTCVVVFHNAIFAVSLQPSIPPKVLDHLTRISTS